MAQAGERVLEEALAVGAPMGDAAGHGGQEGGVGRAPEPGNATHGRRSLQGRPRADRIPASGVDSPDDRRPAPLRRHRSDPRRRRSTRTASGTRRSSRSASPTCGRARPTAPTGSRRWRWRRPGHRRCAAAWPSRRRSPAVPRCSRRPRRRWPTPRPGASRSGSARRRPPSSNGGTASPSSDRVPAHARHAALPPTRARRREGHRALRHLRGAGLPARARARGAAAHPGRRAAPAACCASPARRATAPSSTGSRPSDVAAGRALRRRQGDRRPDLRGADRRLRRGARHGRRARSRATSRSACYAKFQEWLGRGPALQPMWDAWAAGDRARALELVPDEVIDDLIVWGTPERIRERVERLRRPTA